MSYSGPQAITMLRPPSLPQGSSSASRCAEVALQAADVGVCAGSSGFFIYGCCIGSSPIVLTASMVALVRIGARALFTHFFIDRPVRALNQSLEHLILVRSVRDGLKEAFDLLQDFLVLRKTGVLGERLEHADDTLREKAEYLKGLLLAPREEGVLDENLVRAKDELEEETARLQKQLVPLLEARVLEMERICAKRAVELEEVVNIHLREIERQGMTALTALKISYFIAIHQILSKERR